MFVLVEHRRMVLQGQALNNLLFFFLKISTNNKCSMSLCVFFKDNYLTNVDTIQNIGLNIFKRKQIFFSSPLTRNDRKKRFEFVKRQKHQLKERCRKAKTRREKQTRDKHIERKKEMFQ